MRLKVTAGYGIAEVGRYPVVGGIVEVPDDLGEALLKERPADFQLVKVEKQDDRRK